MENNIKIYDEMYYGNCEFDFVRDKSTKEFLKSAHRAISLCELWDWMRIYEPQADRGFMWSKTPELDRLNQQMFKDPINSEHSGSSYGFIMRQMEDISKNGYENFKNRYH
jgi:hypothetical protein